MKYVRWMAGLTAGAVLFGLGLIILGVPADLSLWRYIIGIGTISGAITVWDKWA